MAEQTSTTTAKGDVTIVEPTRAQQLVGRRAAEAKATVPEFAIGAELDLEALVAMRAAAGEVAPPVAALVARAAGLALREHPEVNGAYRDNRFERYSRVNVGVTLAAGDATVLPTIFDADEKSAAAIAGELEQLAAGGQAGTLTAPQVGGGTFTVTLIETHGTRTLTPILTPGQAATLGVAAIAPRAVVVDGAVVVRQVATATLVADQRIIPAAVAAQFLARVGALLETPAAL
jgi:pyruvate dehydrogenase E2 component (dihydrolipoamide acetyltransferase)